MVSKGQGESRGKECECGISRGTLLYTGWKNNKVLLHSTGNYIQYPVKIIMEKYEKEYITESFFHTEEINTPL